MNPEQLELIQYELDQCNDDKLEIVKSQLIRFRRESTTNLATSIISAGIIMIEDKLKEGKTMKNGIVATDYYKLLDWKDNNLTEFNKLYPNKSLNDLTVIQLEQLLLDIKP